MASGKIQSNLDIQVIMIIIVIFNGIFPKKTQHIRTKPDMHMKPRHSSKYPNKLWSLFGSHHYQYGKTTTTTKKRKTKQKKETKIKNPVRYALDEIFTYQ